MLAVDLVPAGQQRRQSTLRGCTHSLRRKQRSIIWRSLHVFTHSIYRAVQQYLVSYSITNKTPSANTQCEPGVIPLHALRCPGPASQLVRRPKVSMIRFRVYCLVVVRYLRRRHEDVRGE